MKEALEIGQKFLFHGRMIYLGEVADFTLMDIIIKKASWMEDMGIRMSELMEKGLHKDTTIEVIADPNEHVVIPRGSFTRIPWNHPLPTESKP